MSNYLIKYLGTLSTAESSEFYSMGSSFEEVMNNKFSGYTYEEIKDKSLFDICDICVTNIDTKQSKYYLFRFG